MKNQSIKKETKTFRFQLNKRTIFFAILGMLLCVAGIATSIWRLSTEKIEGLTDALQSPLLIAVCIFGLVVLISMLVRSQYLVDGKDITVQFGIIKSKTPIESVTAIEMDTDTNKISLYTGESYTVISVNKAWNDEFVKAIQAVKPSIDYSIVLVKHKPKDEEK